MKGIRLWTLIKLVAGTLVISAVAMTTVAVWQNRVKALPPLNGIIPTVAQTDNTPPLTTLPTEEGDAPDIDPGAEVFDKARDVIALGDYPSAREKLNTIVTTYPRSKAAPEARRIVGEMNMDDLLSPAHMEGKSTHVVQKGESFLLIAARERTTIDCIMHLNGMLELTGLHPGDELVVMPLELRVVIEPAKKSLSIWNGADFVKDYHLLSADAGNLKENFTSTIATTYGLLSDSKHVAPASKGYRESQKVFSITKSSLQIKSGREADDVPSAPGTTGKGFILLPEDAEELALILRPGNEVAIRTGAR